MGPVGGTDAPVTHRRFAELLRSFALTNRVVLIPRDRRDRTLPAHTTPSTIPSAARASGRAHVKGLRSCTRGHRGLRGARAALAGADLHRRRLDPDGLVVRVTRAGRSWVNDRAGATGWRRATEFLARSLPLRQGPDRYGQGGSGPGAGRLAAANPPAAPSPRPTTASSWRSRRRSGARRGIRLALVSRSERRANVRGHCHQRARTRDGEGRKDFGRRKSCNSSAAGGAETGLDPTLEGEGRGRVNKISRLPRLRDETTLSTRSSTSRSTYWPLPARRLLQAR